MTFDIACCHLAYYYIIYFLLISGTMKNHSNKKRVHNHRIASVVGRPCCPLDFEEDTQDMQI